MLLERDEYNICCFIQYASAPSPRSWVARWLRLARRARTTFLLFSTFDFLLLPRSKKSKRNKATGHGAHPRPSPQKKKKSARERRGERGRYMHIGVSAKKEASDRGAQPEKREYTYACVWLHKFALAAPWFGCLLLALSASLGAGPRSLYNKNIIYACSATRRREVNSQDH